MQQSDKPEIGAHEQTLHTFARECTVADELGVTLLQHNQVSFHHCFDKNWLASTLQLPSRRKYCTPLPQQRNAKLFFVCLAQTIQWMLMATA